MLIKKSNDYVQELTQDVNQLVVPIPQTLVKSILTRYLKLLQHYLINSKQALKIANKLVINTQSNRIPNNTKPVSDYRKYTLRNKL